MQKNKISQFKNKLEEERKLLESELESVGRRNPSNPNDWEPTPSKIIMDTADDLELAEGIDEYEENAAILNQLEKQYNDVKNALVKIENDKYGICEECGKMIEENRLEANPAAQSCLAHMKKHQ